MGDTFWLITDKDGNELARAYAPSGPEAIQRVVENMLAELKKASGTWRARAIMESLGSFRVHLL